MSVASEYQIPRGHTCRHASMHIMDTPTQPPSSTPQLLGAIVIAASAMFAASCSNPLGPIDADYARRLEPARLRGVERFDREKYAQPPSPSESASSALVRPKSRFEGLEQATLTLEEARASAFSRNLDIRVALISPTISAQSLRAEEAKFEAIFRPRAGVDQSDRPTLNTTQSNTSDTTFVGAGVDIPLRSGGRMNVDLSESHSETTGNSFVTFNSAYSTELQFSISQPLLRNAGRRVNTYSIRIADYNRQISEAQTKLEIIRQLASVDRSYWRLYAARRELEVRQRQFELAQSQLERARRRVNAGDLGEIEIIRAESGVASSLGGIIMAENSVLQQQRELKRIVNTQGLEYDNRTLIIPGSEPDPLRFQFDGLDLATQAVANRMEMLELELQIASDYSTIEYNKNQALPLVTLDYQYGIQGLGGTFNSSTDQFSSDRFNPWSLSINGQIPIGNEAAKARVQQSILQRLQRLSTRDAREQAIRQEVLNAVDTIESTWQQIMAARQSTLAAARTLAAEQRQFDAGSRTSTDVLDASTRLADAQSSEVRAVTDYQIAQVDLAFATGTILGAAKIDWAPTDAAAGEPQGRNDPTPRAFPLYADPDKVTRPITGRNPLMGNGDR